MDTTPYVSVDAVKQVLNIRGDDVGNRVAIACNAATDALNSACDRDFHAVSITGADDERFYTPHRPRTVEIDDVLEIHELAVDTAGNGSYSTIWELGRDFYLEPENAPKKGRPYERIKLHPWSRFAFPALPNALRVTGIFGWAATPPAIIEMALILSVKYYKRPDAAFGVVSFGEVSMQIVRNDPDLASLLQDYTRDTVVY